MDKNTKINDITRYFPVNIRRLFENFDAAFWNKLTSIRITVNSPVIIETQKFNSYLGINGVSYRVDNCYKATQNDINSIFELVTNSSIYTYSRYVNEGYITLSGGNRVGIVGNCVVTHGKITSVGEIYSLNFRVAHEKIGSSLPVINSIYKNGKINNSLIVSPPGCGKTTLLRDVARFLGTYESCGQIIVCALVDERYELGCARGGVKSFDIGNNNFLISGCPKSVAIPLITRSMAPDVIIVDEMCDENDYIAAQYAKNSGCKIIASVHGEDENVNELENIKGNNFFDTTIVLSRRKGVGTIEKILGG